MHLWLGQHPITAISISQVRADWEAWRGSRPRLLQICKKVGQKAAIMEEIWQQYSLGTFLFLVIIVGQLGKTPPPPTEGYQHITAISAKLHYCSTVNHLVLHTYHKIPLSPCR